jgi:hypothetical protein
MICVKSFHLSLFVYSTYLACKISFFFFSSILSEFELPVVQCLSCIDRKIRLRNIIIMRFIWTIINYILLLATLLFIVWIYIGLVNQIYVKGFFLLLLLITKVLGILYIFVNCKDKPTQIIWEGFRPCSVWSGSTHAQTFHAIYMLEKRNVLFSDGAN